MGAKTEYRGATKSQKNIYQCCHVEFKKKGSKMVKKKVHMTNEKKE